MLRNGAVGQQSSGFVTRRPLVWPCELILESTKPPTLEEALRAAIVALRSYQRGAASPDIAAQAAALGEAALAGAGLPPLVRAPSDGPIARASAAADHLRARARFFPGLDFGDPVWLALLDLEKAHLRRRTVTVSALADPTPATTVLRVVDRLEAGGWIVSRRDPKDRRKRIVVPTRSTLAALAAWRRSCR